MPYIIEQSPVQSPNQLLPEQRDVVHPVLGRIGLVGVDISAGHFYGSEEHFIGKTPRGEHRIIIGTASEEGVTRREAVGVGTDVESALKDSLEKMRTLETVRTRSLVHIEMTGSSFASFTTLEHYNPKVAPSRETYPVPDYLETTITDSEDGNQTYRNTVEREGWQTELRTVLADYLQNDKGGQQLVKSLKIRSLSHLTPEQAVKLSAAFVQNVSRYTKEDVGSKDLTRSDQSNTAELLREGIANRKDPNWKGNGVCRNVASNVKAVFEALKATQAELSMLNNTYAVYGSGAEGAGYSDKRSDNNSYSIGEKSGHAWNTFVTVDSSGSTVSTIIDATWALGADTAEALSHLDRTEVRAASQLFQLFEQSEAKAKAFNGLTYYVDNLIRNNPKRDTSSEGIRGFATTEYLKAASLLPEIPEDFALPEKIVNGAYELIGKLDPEEIKILFALDQADSSLQQDKIGLIIAGNDKSKKAIINDQRRAENLVFADEELQQLVYESVGDARVAQLAEKSGVFRARLREIRPDTLPIFNAEENQADALELSHFASFNGIHDKDPKMIMRQFNNRLKKLAGDDVVYEAIVAGRTDYDLAKSFNDIVKALRNKPKS